MEELFTNLTKFYIDKCNIKQLPNLQILVVEDIYEEYLKLEADENNINQIKIQKDIISGNNGLTIYPSKNRDYFTILISKEEVEKFEENNLLMFCTLWHELTHVIDFQNENLRQQLLSYEDNLMQQIYHIIHYLARYSIWEELEPDYYKDGEQFPYWLSLISNNILDLYIYIKELNCFDKAKYNFGKLVDKINQLNKEVD